MKDLSKIKSVKTLNLQKNDILVVEIKEDAANDEMAGFLRDQFQKLFPKNKVIVHCGLKLSVVKQEKKSCKKN